MQHVELIRKREKTARVGGIIAISGSIFQMAVGIALFVMWKSNLADQIPVPNANVYLFIMALLSIFSGLYGLQHGLHELKNKEHRAILELADEIDKIKSALDRK